MAAGHAGSRRATANPPSIQEVAMVVSWAYAYAPSERPLNAKHPLYGAFFPLAERFRTAIAEQLGLSPDTPWETIYRIAGFLISEEYASEEEYRKAWRFGSKTPVTFAQAPEVFEELERVKFQIVDRI